jgi:hypothetical protein
VLPAAALLAVAAPALAAWEEDLAAQLRWDYHASCNTTAA